MAVFGKIKGFVMPLEHANENWLLIPQEGFNLEPEFRVSGVLLSKAGKELFPIVEKSSHPEYTQALVEFFAKQKLQMVNMNEEKI